MACVDLLLKSGARIEGEDGPWLLFAIAEFGGADAARRLVAEGVDLYRRDDRGRDAAMIAASSGNSSVLGALIELGADPLALDGSGLGLAEIARGSGDSGCLEIAEALELGSMLPGLAATVPTRLRV
jgi:ankyrin repeat protein